MYAWTVPTGAEPENSQSIRSPVESATGVPDVVQLEVPPKLQEYPVEAPFTLRVAVMDSAPEALAVRSDSVQELGMTS
jgi:hypothetical protein